MLANRILTRAPQLFKQAVRCHHGGIPGQNLPFSFDNKLKFTIGFTIFLTTGTGLPYFALHHQLTK